MCSIQVDDRFYSSQNPSDHISQVNGTGWGYNGPYQRRAQLSRVESVSEVMWPLPFYTVILLILIAVSFIYLLLAYRKQLVETINEVFKWLRARLFNNCIINACRRCLSREASETVQAEGPTKPEEDKVELELRENKDRNKLREESEGSSNADLQDDDDDGDSSFDMESETYTSYSDINYPGTLSQKHFQDATGSSMVNGRRNDERKKEHTVIQMKYEAGSTEEGSSAGQSVEPPIFRFLKRPPRMSLDMPETYV